MRLPGFSAETSLYRTSRHYRTIAKFGQADGIIHPTFSIQDFIELSPDFFDISLLGPTAFISVRVCCRDCMSGCNYTDELRQKLCRATCTIKCGASDIGGCGCPPERLGCRGQCCKPGEVCTLDGCSDPSRVCNNRRCGPFERCTPVGCCPEDSVVCNDRCCPRGSSCSSDGCCPEGHVVCNNRCCLPGWSCTSEGCCPPGVCCESTACPPGKFCCGGKVCCRDGADCRLVNGTSEYGCFR
jgi:hypothetical protein